MDDDEGKQHDTSDGGHDLRNPSEQVAGAHR
jgi:hypothetical protein